MAEDAKPIDSDDMLRAAYADSSIADNPLDAPEETASQSANEEPASGATTDEHVGETLRPDQGRSLRPWWQRRSWLGSAVGVVVFVLALWQSGVFDDLVSGGGSSFDASEAPVLTGEIPPDWQPVDHFEDSHGFVMSVPGSWSVLTGDLPGSEEGTPLVMAMNDAWSEMAMVVGDLSGDAGNLDALVAEFESDPTGVAERVGAATAESVDWVVVGSQEGVLVVASDPSFDPPWAACYLYVASSRNPTLMFSFVTESPATAKSLCDEGLGTIRWTDQ